jgi:hypothetical protein
MSEFAWKSLPAKLSRLVAAFSLILLGAEGFANAQNWTSWHFEPHTYYDPVAAEPRAAETKIMFFGRGEQRSYCSEPRAELYWGYLRGSRDSGSWSYEWHPGDSMVAHRIGPLGI